MALIPIAHPLKPRPKGARKKSMASRERSGEQAPATHGYFTSFDGTQLFYSIEGKGKPLIFCYGLVCTSLHWTYQIEHFQSSYQSIWFDYRGHQNSETPKDLNSLTVENFARDIRILCDELKIEDAVFLGHSMGVNVVLELYRQQPERVAAMVLANGTARRPLETLFHSNALQTGFKLLRKAHDKSPQLVEFLWKLQKNNPVARTLMSLSGFNPYLTPAEDVEFYINQIAEMDPRILINLIENYDRVDATAWLHTIRAPTLIIGGEHDHAIPLEQQQLLHQLIPGSRFEVIRHGSHCPQMDLPELVNLKIERFLQEIGYAPGIGKGESQKALPSPNSEC
jgi:pimeloyl-ACP methyl ester carboxylesterase